MGFETMLNTQTEPSLNSLGVVDGSLHEGFERLTRLATSLLDTPVALISIVEFANDRQFFVSAQGLPEPWVSKRETPLSHSFCQHVKTSAAPLIVSDARVDPLVKDNLAVTELGVIAYLGVPIFGPDEEAVGALCVIDVEPRDWSQEEIDRLTDLAGAVTDQMQLHMALWSNERASQVASRFGRIIEAARHEVYMIDTETLKFVHVNQGACNNLGYRLDELQAMTPLDIKPEYDAISFDALVAPLRDGDVAELQFDTIHRRKDGSDYPVNIRLERHVDSLGELFVAFCKDTTKTRKLEEELRAMNADFQALFEHSPDAVAFADAEAVVNRANPAFLKIYGNTASQIIGKRCCHQAPAEELAKMIERVALCTPANPAVTFLEEREVNGKPVKLLWTNVVLFDGENPRKIIYLARDVTKTAEMEKAKAVAEAAAVQAQSSNRAKTAFLANMSHELRTPLNAIIGFSEITQMMLDPDTLHKEREYLGHVSDSGKHLVSLIDDILDLAKIEADGRQLDESEFCLTSLLQSTLNMLSPMAVEKNLRLRLGGCPLALKVEADERAIKQIVLNLATNALRYTSNHGNVTLNCELDPDGRVTISVVDDGEGIAPHELEKIKEPFARSSKQEKAASAGVGLGLSIVNALAELHGGHLSLTSKVGKGTRASVVLPASRTISVASARPAGSDGASMSRQKKAVA